MNSVNIINHRYLNDQNYLPTVGGIQTYIRDLSKIIISLHLQVTVYQMASHNFEVVYEDVRVIGIKCKWDELAKKAIRRIPADELVIFATESLAKKYHGKSIIIQHGIFWDDPSLRRNALYNRLYLFKHAFGAYKRLSWFHKADKIVCVDYNFINWFRTQVAYTDIELIPIPNYTRLPEFCKKSNKDVRIIFARRLVRMRGTRIFCSAIQRILDEYENVSVTIAGDGPDEVYLKERLSSYKNVEFITYSSDQSLDVHMKYDIAVVPTVGSEGTSLSLLEAMAASCAVVCSDVGGMTNIVLNRFNGIMFSSGNEVELYDAIKELITDSSLRNQLAVNGYNTVCHAFSYDLWKNRWKKVLIDIMNGQ